MASSNDESTAQPQGKKLKKLVKRIKGLDSPMVICIANCKGGVGKTTLSTNIAYELSTMGLKVLALGLCTQIDFEARFGLTNTDKGWSIFQAVMGQGGPVIHHDVRPNLDVIVGGKQSMMLDTLSGANQTIVPGKDATKAFQKAMGEAFADYDVVVIDFPPQNTVVQLMALSVTDWIVVPMKTDQESIDGLEDLAALVPDVLQYNPNIRYAGIALFAVLANATAMLRDHLKDVAALETGIPIFNTKIRASAKVGRDSRIKGKFYSELAARSREVQARKFEALHSGKVAELETFSNATAAAADELRDLTLEILDTAAGEM